MADWTSADEKQLAALEARARELEAQDEGDPAADTHVAAVRKPEKPEEASPFSTVRTIIGMGRDVIQDTLNTAEALGDKLEQIAPLPVVRLGSNAKNGVVDVVYGDEAAKFSKEHRDLPSIPDVPGSEHAGAAERITRSIGSFLIPYAGWAKKFAVAKAGIGVVNRIGRAAAAGFATDFVNQDPSQNNMASVIKDTFGIDNETLDWLSYHEDDDELVQRLKAASTNLPVGVAADALFELGAKAIRAYGAVKGEAEEAKGIVEALERDYGVKPVPQPRSVDAEAGVADELVKPAEEPFKEGIHAAIEQEQPKSWEDILSFLERKVDDPNLKDEELEQLRQIVEDDPENALTRMGLDPAKLDYHAFDNPEGITNLQKSLINIYEKVGRRLGRSTVRVSEAEINVAARSMASEAEVLKTLFGSTKNLPEILMAARMFVGGHARVLLDTATQTLEALKKEGPEGEAAWQAFLAAFHRHALYLGTLRGAGSEIGRALRSLRMVARTDPKQVEGFAKEAGKLAPEVGSKEAAKESADDALTGVMGIKDDAERIMLLSKLLEKEGDIGALAQFVRGKSASPLKRADGIVRETTSNLFSVGTAAYNIKSGLSMIGMRMLGRWMAAVARMPLALLGGEQARLFRIAAADAWAYTDGALLAVGEAFRNTMSVLEREGASELYINADNLGLKKLAKKAALTNAEEAGKTLGKNFERVDIDATPRRFALNPSDREKLEQFFESESLPQIVIRGMHFILRGVGASANALGTLTRLGTILFINAPDQFIGTIAAKAGAQSAALREAARRAAELGIEGRDLSKYLKARVASLATDVDGWADDGFTAGMQEVSHAAGEHEARAVLFQDPIESPSMRRISRAVGQARFGSIVIPFPHTPVRILERTMVDFTPLGLLKQRVREAILHGPPQAREQALAQMGLGIFAMYMADRMVEDRGIVGNDGSFVSTARLNRESYTMRIGGDVYEFSRDDPLGTLWGLAADYHTYMDHHDPDDPEAVSKGQAMWEAGAWAAAANMLSKTWLVSMKNLTELAGALTEGEFTSGLERYIRMTVGRRLVPGAGIQKGAEMVFDPFERQALTFQEEVLKNTIGSYKLPEKRDWLGDPEPKNLGERFIGLTWKPESNEPLVRELDRLSIQTRLPQKNIKGVDLTSEQYSRLLELRGGVVKKDFGTMKEALEALTIHPGWKGLTDAAKVAQIKDITDGYTEEAKKALLAEDPVLHARVIRKAAYDDSRSKSFSQQDLREQNAALGEALGLGSDN